MCIKIQEHQVKRHQATLIISSILTKSYHPVSLLPLHAKIETVHHKAPITETRITSFKLCIVLHQDMTRLDFWSLYNWYILGLQMGM